jgi:flagellar biosynthesis protein FlhF
MIIKSFTAPTVAAALKMVKEVMGGDAVVLKTRVLPVSETAVTGNKIEVTACIDESVVSPGRIDEILSPVSGNLQSSVRDFKSTGMKETESVIESPEDFAVRLAQKIEPSLEKNAPSVHFEPEINAIYLKMLDADIPAEFARQMVEQMVELGQAGENLENVARETLVKNIEAMIGSAIEYKPGARIVFTGQSGAGKTSALAKLAARLTTELKQKVVLVTLDNFKVSAYEEIGSYADILNLPLEQAKNLGKPRHDDAVILIDTPAIPQEESRRQSFLNNFRAVKPDIVFLVFSAGARSVDLMESINYFEALSPTHLIAAHLDETTRWGGLTAMGRYLETPLAYIMDAPGGIGRLKHPDPEKITDLILKPMELCHEG